MVPVRRRSFLLSAATLAFASGKKGPPSHTRNPRPQGVPGSDLPAGATRCFRYPPLTEEEERCASPRTTGPAPSTRTRPSRARSYGTPPPGSASSPSSWGDGERRPERPAGAPADDGRREALEGLRRGSLEAGPLRPVRPRLLSNIRELEAGGLPFVCTSQGIDARPGGDATGRLILGVLAWVAEFERDLIRDRTGLGLERPAGTESGSASPGAPPPAPSAPRRPRSGPAPPPAPRRRSTAWP